MKLFALALLAALIPSYAYAYFGPGAALGMIGYLFGFAASFGLALLILAYYPIRILYKRRKQKKMAESYLPLESVPESEKQKATEQAETRE